MASVKVLFYSRSMPCWVTSNTDCSSHEVSRKSPVVGPLDKPKGPKYPSIGV